MSKFVITIPVYNAEKYIERCLISALQQNYSDYNIVIVDDCSTDNTWNIICQTIDNSDRKNLVRFLKRNDQRIGALANHYQMSLLCDEDEVIVNLDGDDELAHLEVLNHLDDIYKDEKIWMTYGSYEYDLESRNPDPNASPRGICFEFNEQFRSPRRYFGFSHLRTYKKWLFAKIKIYDLKINGNFYQKAMDHALMFPMIEMAGAENSKYIHDILYLYNAANSLNEHKIGIESVMETADYIKSKNVYPKITSKNDVIINHSWSEEDHLRHFLYQSIYSKLSTFNWENKKYDVLDFGSMWFGDPDGGWQTYMRWIMKDLLGKENVNHILATYPEYNAEDLLSVPDNSIDILIADQVLEHVERPWLASETFHRVLKKGGLAIVATPGFYPIHPSPLDCWRIMPHGYKVLFPDVKWNTILFDTWGSANRLAYELSNNKDFLNGGRTYTVTEAMGQPFYQEKDNLCPIQLWWIGEKI